MAFTGTFEHNLDTKNRLTIPSKFRADLSKGVYLSRAIEKVISLYPAETYVLLNGERRKAMADQITTASKRRLQRRLGALGPDDLDAVSRVVRLQLGL